MHTRTLALVASVALAGALAPVAARAVEAGEQRQRLLFESQRMDEDIRKQGLLHGDAQLDAYLQSVMDRMYPEAQGKLVVRAIRDEEMNAFALPSGSIYVNTGALLRIRNEAELASLLGHEATHVIEEHSYEAVSSGKALAGAALVLGAGLTAVIGFNPMLGDIAAISTMAGFSRAREREADELGHQRMVQAGYDTRATATFFDRVQREMAVRKLDKNFYAFASHPRFESRVDAALDAATNTTAAGELRRDEYLAATAAVRLQVLTELRDKRRSSALTFLLGEEGLADENPPHGHFLLGEGYRLRAEQGDVERALAEYRISIERAPLFAPAWGALGRHYAKTGDAQAALLHLDRYLELAPDAREAPFARQAVERLRRDAAPPPATGLRNDETN